MILKYNLTIPPINNSTIIFIKDEEYLKESIGGTTMKKHFILAGLLFILFLTPFAFAEENTTESGDWEIGGLEVEKLLNLGSGILATALCFVTLSAYKTTNRKRLLYVAIAFALFAIKGFLTSTELFFGDWTWVDPVASMFNFGILLAFFVGIIKK